MCKPSKRFTKNAGVTNGAYFDEAVGYEYGTSGMQSCVSCGCSGSGDMYAPEMMQPSMMAPMNESHSVIGSGVHGMQGMPMQQMQQMQPTQQMMQGAPAQGAHSMLNPAVGAINSINGVIPNN
ncbi:hypothetical protein N9Y42_07360 [Mariniblastus sp.]|nr:hypothetical protein [Mariniblastus sp.]